MLRQTTEILTDRRVRYLPITVFVLAGICWYIDSAGVRYDDVYPEVNPILLVDPVYHASNMFLHFDHAHFVWNMRLLIAFGIVLTVLTSNRHVLVVVVFAQLLANVVSGVAGQFVFGASGVVLALIAASLVRSTGYAMQDASAETVQTVVGSLLSLASLALFLVFLGSGGSGWIAHFHHFLGFLFGGAIESIYLFGGESETETERTVPRRIGR
jgi:membrane associated rhomboid family serine protease